METTLIEWIKKVNSGGIEIAYTVTKECISNNLRKPSTTRDYFHSVVIPKGRIPDLEKAIADKKW